MLNWLNRGRASTVAAATIITLAMAVTATMHVAAEDTDVPAVKASESASVLHEGDGEGVLTVFSAPNCPHCRSFATTLLEVIPERPELTYQVREVAFNRPGQEAIAVMAALEEQGLYRAFYNRFAEFEYMLDGRAMRDLARELGADMGELEAVVADSVGESRVAHNIDLGRAIQIRATPTIVLDGRKLSGAVDRATLLRFIDQGE